MSKEIQREVSLPLLVPPRSRSVCLGLAAAFWCIAGLLWWQQTRGASIDQAALFFFDEARREGSMMILFAKWTSSYGMVAISLVYGFVALLGLRMVCLQVPVGLFLLVIVALGVCGIGGDLLKEVFGRPRPLVTYGEQLMIMSEAATPALPSGHATKSMALALPVLVVVVGRQPFLLCVRGLIPLLAVGVAISRVMLGAHYVSDVVAGVGTALLGLPLAVMVADRIMRRIKPEKMPKMRTVWGILLIVLAFLLTLL